MFTIYLQTSRYLAEDVPHGRAVLTSGHPRTPVRDLSGRSGTPYLPVGSPHPKPGHRSKEVLRSIRTEEQRLTFCLMNYGIKWANTIDSQTSISTSPQTQRVYSLCLGGRTPSKHGMHHKVSSRELRSSD